jgi:hypothetical protein
VNDLEPLPGLQELKSTCKVEKRKKTGGGGKGGVERGERERRGETEQNSWTARASARRTQREFSVGC